MYLVDMGKYKREHGRGYWTLTAIEILSMYAFAIYKQYHQGGDLSIKAIQGSIR